MNLSINIEDFDKICRICLQLSETLMPVSLNDIVNMLKVCASVDISENDELPNQICQCCFTRLQDSFNFKNLCKKSDYNLRQLIAEHKKNKQKEGSIECNDKTFLLKNEVFSIDDELKNYDLETLSIKSEDLPSDDKIEHNYNDETLSLKNEELHTNDEKKNENIEEKIQEEKSSLAKKTKNKTDKKTKTRTKLKKSFTCEKCDRKFDSPWSLGWHCKSTHKTKGTKCSYCSVICYHPVHLKVHEETHTNLTIKCEHCDKKFAYMSSLTSHIMYAHSTDRPFKCSQCDSAFKTKHRLNDHMKAIHALEKQPVKRSSCHICGKTFSHKSLRTHLETHAERKPLDCPKCGKKYSSKDALRNHLKRIHENDTTGCKNLCNVCGRGTKTRTELISHMRTHTGEKPFQCNKCEKRYRTAYALSCHVRHIHLNERKHVCSVCSQAFHVRGVLENHMRRHTGERPFVCFICNKTFGFKVSMQIHLKQVHKVENKPKESINIA